MIMQLTEILDLEVVLQPFLCIWAPRKTQAGSGATRWPGSKKSRWGFNRPDVYQMRSRVMAWWNMQVAPQLIWRWARNVWATWAAGYARNRSAREIRRTTLKYWAPLVDSDQDDATRAATRTTVTVVHRLRAHTHILQNKSTMAQTFDVHKTGHW